MKKKNNHKPALSILGRGFGEGRNPEMVDRQKTQDIARNWVENVFI